MPDIWIPVTQQNLEIEAGSPLDFSTFLSNPPIDEERRLIVNSTVTSPCRAIRPFHIGCCAEPLQLFPTM
ncbi:hypothetical protein HED52_09020 [Ochrobactrum ciceri]|uniref:Uncharacterized protein n=1 Tax=Brucella ciceri TaxID=391287 RepID=A0ABX1DTL1_9HYPH|nr:hypothetical protein [Brucella ciceri]